MRFSIKIGGFAMDLMKYGTVQKRRFALVGVVYCVLSLGLVSQSQAFTQETSASPVLEKQFLAATTNQFQAVLTPNPLAANTYTLKLIGLNPNFNPPPTTLEQALSLGATVYLYGYRDGAGYEEHVDHGIAQGFALDCSTPIPNVTTWDPITCAATSVAISNEIFKQYSSTVAVVTGF